MRSSPPGVMATPAAKYLLAQGTNTCLAKDNPDFPGSKFYLASQVSPLLTKILINTKDKYMLWQKTNTGIPVYKSDQARCHGHSRWQIVATLHHCFPSQCVSSFVAFVWSVSEGGGAVVAGRTKNECSYLKFTKSFYGLYLGSPLQRDREGKCDLTLGSSL